MLLLLFLKLRLLVLVLVLVLLGMVTMVLLAHQLVHQIELNPRVRLGQCCVGVVQQGGSNPRCVQLGKLLGTKVAWIIVAFFVALAVPISLYSVNLILHSDSHSF